MARVYRRIRGADGRLRDRSNGGPGTWYVDYLDGSGRHVRKATVATTKGEALAILRKLQSEAARAEIAGVSSSKALTITFQEFVDQEYIPHVEGTRREGTVNLYKRYAAVTSAVLGLKPLRSICRGDVERYVAQRQRDGRDGRSKEDGRHLSAATINRETAFIRAVLYKAMGREYIDRNPAARIELLEEKNTRKRTMSPFEEEKVLGKCPAWLRPIVKVSLLAGLRRGEILRLKWSDVADGRIEVSAESKSGEARTVPITPDLQPVFNGLDRMVLEGRAVEWVFPDAGGEARDKYQVAGAFTKAVEDAAILDLHFHDLRRTFASRLADKGVGLPVIAKLLGHGATYVTERYAHASDQAMDAAVELLSKPSPAAPAHTNCTHAPVLKASNE